MRLKVLPALSLSLRRQIKLSAKARHITGKPRNGRLLQHENRAIYPDYQFLPNLMAHFLSGIVQSSLFLSIPCSLSAIIVPFSRSQYSFLLLRFGMEQGNRMGGFCVMAYYVIGLAGRILLIKPVLTNSWRLSKPSLHTVSPYFLVRPYADHCWIREKYQH